MVLHEKEIGVNFENDDSIIDTYLSPFSIQVPPNNNEKEVDDVQANCNDHDEGKLVNIV